MDATQDRAVQEEAVKGLVDARTNQVFSDAGPDVVDIANMRDLTNQGPRDPLTGILQHSSAKRALVPDPATGAMPQINPDTGEYYADPVSGQAYRINPATGCRVDHVTGRDFGSRVRDHRNRPLDEVTGKLIPHVIGAVDPVSGKPSTRAIETGRPGLTVAETVDPGTGRIAPPHATTDTTTGRYVERSVSGVASAAATRDA